MAYYLAWRMGAGKSVTALTHIDEVMNREFVVEKALIVAPLKTCETTWISEPAKWGHLKNLKVVSLLGDRKQREQALTRNLQSSTSRAYLKSSGATSRAKDQLLPDNELPGDVYVINRDNFIWLVEYYGKQWPFDMVIWDEATWLKGGNSSKTWKIMRKLRKYISRLVFMSGTPNPNDDLEEVWAQITLLDETILPRTVTEFRSRYLLPDKRNGSQIYSYRPRPGAKEEVFERIAPIMHTLKDSDYPYKPDPEPIEIEVDIPMLTYHELEAELVVDDIVAETAAVLSGKLRQIASGSVFDENGDVVEIHKAKLDQLEELLAEAADERVIVFYEYTHTREAILKRFKGFSTKLDMEGWRSGKVKRLLLHPASAGHGVDGLQHHGSIIIWMGPPWSLEQWQQANARLDRQGQTRAVRIYTLLAAGTVDQLALQALRRKDIGQEQLLKAIRDEFAKRQARLLGK